jgi:hypothetical protein
MNRNTAYLPSVVVNTAAATSGEILFTEFGGGFFYVPTGSSITSITWYTAPASGGTYLAANDEDGVAIVQTVAAAKAYAIPSGLFGACVLKAVGDAAGTIDVFMKA